MGISVTTVRRYVRQGGRRAYLRPKPVSEELERPAAMRDITQGNNGDFAAALKWDACTGLGSPDGKKVAGVV